MVFILFLSFFETKVFWSVRQVKYLLQWIREKEAEWEEIYKLDEMQQRSIWRNSMEDGDAILPNNR